MMELLAPAGDRAALEAAVRGGADAIYLGLTALNARRTAGNFDEEALCAASDYCHERGLRVYVTVNTLVKEKELSELESVARQLARAGVDAAIVQDLGAAAALRAMLPSLALHASTQMAVGNRQGVAFCRDKGFSRVVLARETRFEEIAQCAAIGPELEVFGHGALCTACSGQCLFSSLVGGRSGNRGLCAQPCRLPYRLSGPLCEAAGDLLSPRDLMMIEDLDALARAGARSLKLEGRLKNPAYVYAVTSVYRRALDGEKVDKAALRGVFNRGYTRGYGPGVDDKALMQDPDEKHVETMAAPRAPSPRAIPLAARLSLRAGRRARLCLTDGESQVERLGEEVQKAVKAPVPAERVRAQLEKTGGTPYRMERAELELGEDVYVPASDLNALRREALIALGALRAERLRGCARQIAPLPGAHPPETEEGKPRLCVESSDARLLLRAREWGAEELIYRPKDVTDLSGAPDFPFTLALAPALSGDDLAALWDWAARNGENIHATLLENPAHLALSWPGQRRAGFFLNAANSWTVRDLNMPYVPSVELTAQEIRALGGEKELIVYGRLPLMLLKHCPLNGALGGGAHARCDRCDRARAGIEAHALIDRKGVSFPLSRLKTGAGCVVTVLNAVPLMLLRRAEKLPRAARWRIVLTDEDEGEARRIVRLHRMALDARDYRMDPDWPALCASPSTTGHYFRGVE